MLNFFPVIPRKAIIACSCSKNKFHKADNPIKNENKPQEMKFNKVKDASDTFCRKKAGMCMTVIYVADETVTSR